jgi:hypothetical protein
MAARLYLATRVGSRDAPRRPPARVPTAAVAGLALSGCVAQRPEDPVVITGAQVPRLAGATPGSVVAFRWLDGRWEQVPVQVDERAQVDLGGRHRP